MSAAAALVLVVSFFRGMAYIDLYPVYHWFISYHYGFVKRGLIGTLMYPLYNLKTVAENIRIVNYTSTLVLFLMFTFTVLLYKSIAARRSRDGGILHLHAAMLVFTSSAAAVVAVYSNGYFDHFLEIFCLLSIVAAMRDRWYLSAACCVVAALTHEMFILYGFPIAALAMLRRSLTLRKQGIAIRPIILRLTVFVVLFMSTVAVLYSVNATPKGLIVDRIIRDISKKIGVSTEQAADGVFHLRNNHKAIADMQVEIGTRFKDKTIAVTTYPSTGFLILVIFLILLRKRQVLFFVPTVAAVLAPMILHFIAWDTVRFSAYTTFHALFALYIICLDDEETPPLRVPETFAVVVLGLALSAHNLFTEIYWMRFPVTEEAGNIRRIPPIRWFEICQPLFENSIFDNPDLKNWSTASGFEHRNSVPFMGHYQGGPVGLGYLTSAPRPKAEGKKSATEIVSIPFTVQKSRIIFMMKSDTNRNPPFVSLEIDGRRVKTTVAEKSDVFLRYSWDVRNYVNRTARIRIVDNKPWTPKRASVDGFCFGLE